MSARTIAIHAHKGGVGKTTTTVAVASALAEDGKKVLVIDTDDQADLTAAFFGPDASTEFNKLNTTAALFDEQLDPGPDDLIQETGVENIWLVASTPLLSQHSDHNRFTEFALRDLIETVSDAFDFIIIDTPPSINSQSTWASLLAANAVAMCVQLEPFSGHSLSRGEKLIEMARKAGNPNLQFLGYIPTLKDQRLKIHAGYEVSLRELYNTDVFETVINRLSPFVEAQHHRQTVLKYASSSSAATTVRQLGKEIQQRLMTRKAA